MAITPTDPPTLPRQYPHVEGVADWRAQQSLRLVWDRVFDLEARLQAAESTTGELVSATNRQDDHLTAVERKADAALSRPQLSADDLSRLIDEGGGVLPAGGDGGEGAAGFHDPYPTGHPTTMPVTLSAREAGKIVGGTDQEFAALLAVVADQPTREANIQELRDRILWHLQQAGFTCGLQKNPSNAIAMGKITVIVDGITRAYDVLRINDHADPVETRMMEVGSPNMQPATPIAD